MSALEPTPDSAPVRLRLSAHHDGSERYVSQHQPVLGESVPVRVRVPRSCGYQRVVLRSMADGEIRPVTAVPVDHDEHEVWYEAPLLMHNPITCYRFMLIRSDGDFDWLTATGVWPYDPPDVFDFTLTTFGSAPAWSRAGVVYQIFPDRFARSVAAGSRPVPTWGEPTPWARTPAVGGDLAARQLYGGDLAGISDHLDHLAELGIGTIYLTPIFPARSAHRYDATTFATVDPLLGGDAALVSLSAAVHARGMRLVGDLTTNHTGDGHEWFVRALAHPDAIETDYYLWRSYPHEYVSWLDVPSLPKLNWASSELRKQVIDGADSIVARWLQAPYDLDGWRIDVANMTGRHRDQDLTHDVARTVRRTVEAARADAVLVAEHMHDPSHDLDGDGWQSAMNYAGFTRPLWTWLCGSGNAVNYMGLPTTVPRRSGVDVARSMQEFAAAIPWRVFSYQWNNLGSHDTVRLRTIVADVRLVEVAAGLLATYPGVPMIFAGDEWGAEGVTGEQGRVAMPWGEPGRQDHELFAVYRTLIALRNAHPALQEGGMRWVLVHDDALAYVRETDTETLLVLASRAPWPGALLPADLPGLDDATLLHGEHGLARDGDGWHLPGAGPAVGIWLLRGAS